MSKNIATALQNIDGIIHFGHRAMPRLARVLGRDIEAKSEVAVTLDWSAFDTTI